MIQYYDPVPYVLPDEDYVFEPEDDMPEIEINRRKFDSGDCWIFFYAFASQYYDCDVMVWKDRHGQVAWSLNDESFCCVSSEDLSVLLWMLNVVQQMLENFDHYWNSDPHNWSLPDTPTGWRVVIK